MKKVFKVLSYNELQDIDGGYQDMEYVSRFIVKVYKKIFRK